MHVTGGNFSPEDEHTVEKSFARVDLETFSSGDNPSLEAILDRYWWPHRLEVESAVRKATARGFRVFHVAVHSFTPKLGGETRNADIGLLYDSRRSGERALCRQWQESLRVLAPDLRVRRNYPYRGMADGLPTWLRKRFPDRLYAGVELELNQALLAGAGPRQLASVLAQGIEPLLRAGG